MNFPYETEKSYLYGGNCLIMEVNPSVPNKPISKKSRIFASDNKIFCICLNDSLE